MLKKPTKDEKQWQQKKKKFRCDCATYNEHCKKELEKMVKSQIRYTCDTCLRSAYEALSEGKNAYVSDEELVESSQGKIRRM